jgi:hypothetical protein
VRKIALIFVMSWLIIFNHVYAGSIKEEYELSERCKKSADEWFQKEWGGKHLTGDKDMTIMADYKCHYNKKLNKCFVLLTTISIPKNKKDNKVETVVLFDINENKEYGSYDRIGFENGYGRILDMKSSAEVECNTKGAWDSLVKLYMEE